MTARSVKAWDLEPYDIVFSPETRVERRVVFVGTVTERHGDDCRAIFFAGVRGPTWFREETIVQVVN